MNRSVRIAAASGLCVGLALSLASARAAGEPEPTPPAAGAAPAETGDTAPDEQARKARIDELIAAIRKDQRTLVAMIEEPPPGAPTPGGAPPAQAQPAARVPPIPLRPEVREIAERLPRLQRELHELGGDKALLDTPLVWQ